MKKIAIELTQWEAMALLNAAEEGADLTRHDWDENQAETERKRAKSAIAKLAKAIGL